MAKPAAGVPEFAEDGLNVTEPPGGIKTTGFLAGISAKSSYVNWLFRQCIDWIGYLDGFTGEANTWTAPQTHEGEAGDTNPGVNSETVPTKRKLMFRWKCATNYYARVYKELWNPSTYMGGFTLTVNAYWDGTTWAPDQSGPGCVALRLNNDGLKLGRHASGGGVFSEAAFFTNVILLPVQPTYEPGQLLGVPVGGVSAFLAGGPFERIREADTPISTFTSGWAPFTGTSAPVGFIDAFGYATLMGQINGSGASALTVGSVPPAFVPYRDSSFVTCLGPAADLVKVHIESSSGHIVVESVTGLGAGAFSVALDGVRYRVAT